MGRNTAVDIAGLMLALLAAVLPGPAGAQPAGLSPDPRPTLLLLPPQDELPLVRPAGRADGRRMSLAARLGRLFAPTVRRPGGREPLPPAWRTAQPDRGFGDALGAPLAAAGNWPWKSLHVAADVVDLDRQIARHAGGELFVATFHYALLDLSGRVRLSIEADLSLRHAAATAHEARESVHLRYESVPVAADSAHPLRYAELFRAQGAFDGLAAQAAADLGRFLALVVARAGIPANLRQPDRPLSAYGVRIDCPPCRPADAVLYRQPDRIWVQTADPPDTILSLPLESSSRDHP